MKTLSDARLVRTGADATSPSAHSASCLMPRASCLMPVASCLLLLFSCAAAFARLSEPANIYYGEARGAQGEVLTGEFKGVVTAYVNGRECARATTGGYRAPDVNYVLRVPLDDGWETRYAPYAARVGETPELRIAYGGNEFAIEQAVPPVGPRTTLQRVDLQAMPEPAAAAALVIALLGAARRALKRDGGHAAP